MTRNLVYVDTDISLGTPRAEIDDGAALIFLLRDPTVEVVGAGSVFGNVPVRDAHANLDRLLTWLDSEHIPMGLGAERPLHGDMDWFSEWQSGYGETLAWETRPPTMSAAALIIHAVHAHPGQLSLLALGPMTNVALAIQRDPSVIPLTKEVIAMGGSFHQQDPTPEFNAHCDPEAAALVLNAGWKVHLLGLDITRRAHFSRREFLSLQTHNFAVELLTTQAHDWIDRVESMGWDEGGCALHDAVAVAYLIDRSLFESETCCVEVELEEAALRGVTRFSPARTDEPSAEVITGIDADACRELIWSHLQG